MGWGRARGVDSGVKEGGVDIEGNNTSLTHLPSVQPTRSAGQQANNKQLPIRGADVAAEPGCTCICVFIPVRSEPPKRPRFDFLFWTKSRGPSCT